MYVLLKKQYSSRLSMNSEATESEFIERRKEMIPGFTDMNELYMEMVTSIPPSLSLSLPPSLSLFFSLYSVLSLYSLSLSHTPSLSPSLPPSHSLSLSLSPPSLYFPLSLYAHYLSLLTISLSHSLSLLSLSLSFSLLLSLS